MESCLLCLEIRSNKLDCIRTDSKKWTELNIANTVEKHFWPLNTIRIDSFICSPCWRLVEDFHKFYLRIERAHMKFIIKVNNENINDFCFQKPGRNQTVEDLTTDVNIKNESIDMDEDTENMSDTSCKQYIEVANANFPSQKMGKVNIGKSRKRKCSAEISLEIRKKSEGIHDDSESSSDIYEDDVNSQSDNISADDNQININKDFHQNNVDREENDRLILEYFRQINCNICKMQFENFSTLRKHFLESHQQKGYILCCNRKFFKQKDLAEHIHCHLNPSYFKCDQCSKMFSGHMFLEQHQLREHSSDELAKEHSCDVCSKPFLNIQSLKMHKLSHLPEAEATNFCKEHNKIYMSFTENDFEEKFVENNQEINANHSDLPNMSCTLLTDFSEPLPSSTTSSFSKNDVKKKNEDIFAVLKEILRGQKACNTRLKKLEQNQNKMMLHKNMLSNGQVVIVNNQQQIVDTMEKLVASIVQKPEMITQEKLLTECKVSIKKVEESVCRMTGKSCDKKIKEVASMLPLRNVEAVQEVEQKLEIPDFAEAMMSYLNKVKGTSEDVSSVIRILFTDDLLEKFNWEGRWEKRALGKLTLFNKTLRAQCLLGIGEKCFIRN